jgi:hypothetical protein
MLKNNNCKCCELQKQLEIEKSKVEALKNHLIKITKRILKQNSQI